MQNLNRNFEIEKHTLIITQSYDIKIKYNLPEFLFPAELQHYLEHKQIPENKIYIMFGKRQTTIIKTLSIPDVTERISRASEFLFPDSILMELKHAKKVEVKTTYRIRKK